MLSLPSLRSLCSPKKARRVWPRSSPTAPAALLGAALLALHATPARAQQLHVVPAALSDLEGPSSFGVPGVSHSALRIQIVIGASELTPVAGRSLTGLWLRRDKIGRASCRERV